ncbi:hypothetical protein CU103_09985 [Phyllobacterium sophorae]|uniref:Uncharacterized protein n=1 Tax=Phyllobacterium sophorae TaxID=1520277 RepID=A0A2P7BFQ0_9HYPH|nr:hypothetical protein CU103_09985 [Phyllobacterium sophorae]
MVEDAIVIAKPYGEEEIADALTACWRGQIGFLETVFQKNWFGAPDAAHRHQSSIALVTECKLI